MSLCIVGNIIPIPSSSAQSIWEVADPKKKAGNVLMVAESSKKKRQKGNGLTTGVYEHNMHNIRNFLRYLSLKLH